MQPFENPSLKPTASAFENAEKENLVRSYLESQKVHAKFYANEGQAFFTSWSHPNPEGGESTPDKPTQFVAGTYGFGTPVLKPRTKTQDQGASSLKNSPRNRTLHDEDKGKSIVACEAPKRVSTFVQGISGTKSKARKRANTLDPDEEHNDRLAERRQRRRTKRAIVTPKELSDAEGLSNDASPMRLGKGRGTKGKGKKEKKPKINNSLALMHGFSAQNVGKNRLTLKPAPTLGVFSKGKASIRTKVANKGKKTTDTSFKIFSESVFLRNARPIGPKVSLEQSASVSGSDASSSVQDISTTPKKVSESLKFKKHSPSPTRTNNPPPKERGSIIWDIELSKTPLGFKTGTSLSSKNIDANTVLNIATALSPSTVQRTPPDAPCQLETSSVEKPGVYIGADQADGSSISIAPSQSASQIGYGSKNGLTKVKTVSRYFQATKESNLAVSRLSASLSAHKNVTEYASPDAFDEIDMEENQDVQATTYDFHTKRCHFQGPNSLLQQDANNLTLSPPSFVTSPQGYLWEYDAEPETLTAAVLPLAASYSDAYSGPVEECYLGEYIGNGEPWGCDEDNVASGLYEYDTPSDHYDYQYEPQDDASYGENPMGYNSIEDYDDPADEQHTTFNYPYVPSRAGEISCHEHNIGEDVYMTMQDDPELIASSSHLPGEISSDLSHDDHSTERFTEGRALLLGIFPRSDIPKPQVGTISKAESDVVKGLKGHWLPQRL